MTKKEFEGYLYIEGGVCAAQGFVANGLHAGFHSDKNKNDLGMVYSETPCHTAAVYTQNKAKAAPVLVTQENLKASGGIARAVLANSKNANAGNRNGKETAIAACELAAQELGIPREQVIVASTGVIGEPLPLQPFQDHMQELVSGLSREGNSKAVNAIMTTDTVPKEAAVEFLLEGKICRLGGMAKGSGMIHPNMATTLNFITTDAAVSTEMLQRALKDVVKVTYNCLSIDGDTSTNDMVAVLANGLAGNQEIREEGEAYSCLKQALYIVMMNMTRMLAADGEGATKLLECCCEGAPDQDTAIIVAKSVIRSPLFKCAMFGEDANWGRILCAIGYADAEFSIDQMDVELSSLAGTVPVCRDGAGIPFSEELAAKVLAEEEINIHINLHQGEGKATAWGCDLTYDYVKINGDYRS